MCLRLFPFGFTWDHVGISASFLWKYSALLKVLQEKYSQQCFWNNFADGNEQADTNKGKICGAQLRSSQHSDRKVRQSKPPSVLEMALG